MGDDPAVVGLVDIERANLRWWMDQLSIRFGVWAPYLLSVKLFGTGEVGFFVPTWIISSSFSSVAYLLLRRNGYSVRGSVFGGLFVVLSPFEILIGTSFANDIFLAGAFVYAYVAWQRRDDFPKLSGALVAALLWFGFFNKAWAVFVVPFLAIDFVGDLHGRRRLAFWSSLVIITLLLHAATADSYMRALGDPFPWMKLLPAHYPVRPGDMQRVLLIYPYQLLVGDDGMHTTLFGAVPYVWLVALCVAVLGRGARDVFCRDRFGTELLVMWLGIFLLINFAPNYYSLREYHSAPRIFRYLTPISFFLSLHTAKLLLDGARCFSTAMPSLVAPLCAVGLLAGNLVGAVRAIAPGRENRRVVEAVVATVGRSCPPVLIIERWQSYFFGRFYLRDRCPKTLVVGIQSDGYADEQVERMERILRAQERALPEGAMLVTGLGSYVYYSCWGCVIDPEHLKGPMAEGWELVRDFGRITFRFKPIEVKLWRWRG